MAEIKGKNILEVCCFEPSVMPGFITSARENFDPGSETRLDYLELLCSKVLLKYNRDR